VKIVRKRLRRRLLDGSCLPGKHVSSSRLELIASPLILRAGIWDFSWAQHLVSCPSSEGICRCCRYLADLMSTTGGILAKPASQYSFFENIAFFKEYPYALPGFVSGAFCLSTAILSSICLNEVSLDPCPFSQIAPNIESDTTDQDRARKWPRRTRDDNLGTAESTRHRHRIIHIQPCDAASPRLHSWCVSTFQ